MWEFIAGLGIGIIVTKLIDAFYIQPFLARKEHEKWLRMERLQSFSALSANLLGLSLEGEKVQSAFEVYGLAARSLLLIENKELAREIDEYIAERDRFFRVNSGDEEPKPGEDADSLYHKVYMDARTLVYRLGEELHSPK